MGKFLDKEGMVHFLGKIKEMNHGLQLMPSITVRFATVNVSGDEVENMGNVISDGDFIDNKILFRINAPQEWIDVALNDENYKIILFHPSTRRKKWTSIDDGRINSTIPTDSRGNYPICAVSLSECRKSSDKTHYFEYPYTVRHLLMRFIRFPKESNNSCLREILYNGTQGECFGRKRSNMYVLGESNATVCWGNSVSKKTNGFSTTYRLGLAYKTPFDANYVAPVNPSEFKARFGLCHKPGVGNRLLCKGKFTNYRMPF